MSVSYWRDMYGARTKDFIHGVIAGVEAFAVWKDGKQRVGIYETPLEQEIKDIKKGLGGG